MKKINNIFLAALLLLSPVAQALILEGRVVGVADGDTITVLDNTNSQHKIRLAGIDAPEKKQPFGNVSKQSLSDLVFGKQVSVDYSKQDRYGRVIGKVLIDGNDANLEQVRRGFAWFYKQYQNDLLMDDRLDYLHAQEAAGIAKVGLWVESSPIPPWEFRKAKRTKLNPDFSEISVANAKPSINPPINVKKSVIVQGDHSDNRATDCLSMPTDADILDCLN